MIVRTEKIVAALEAIEMEEKGRAKSILKTMLNEDFEDTRETLMLDKDELMTILYQLDWIDILKDAVEGRPTSWGVQEGEEYKAVAEWRNASDQLIAPLWKRLEKSIEQEVED